MKTVLVYSGWSSRGSLALLYGILKCIYIIDDISEFQLEDSAKSVSIPQTPVTGATSSGILTPYFSPSPRVESVMSGGPQLLTCCLL